MAVKEILLLVISQLLLLVNAIILHVVAVPSIIMAGQSFDDFERSMEFLGDQVTPDLFQSCTRDIVASRRSGMLRRFVSAVQEGPAAIELHAGDVLRHVTLFPQFIFVTSTQVRTVVLAFSLPLLHMIIGIAAAAAASHACAPVVGYAAFNCLEIWHLVAGDV